MKKLITSVCLIGMGFVTNANPVTQQTAKTVATNFYRETFKLATTNLTLSYSDYSNTGQPVYYVFDVNTDDGFVIVAADDAAHPILGYSNKGQFVIPCPNTNTGWWLNCRKQEIMSAIAKNLAATSDISDEWNEFSGLSRMLSGAETSVVSRQAKRVSSAAYVNPLLQSMWNQSPYYNAMCPGGSVTGCVACAMAQIMRYWSYPSHGHGYSGYVQKQSDGFAENYGYLEADYDTSNYVWLAMPYSISANNYEIAKLMYDCGVSVDMDYSPGESGAWVINGDYPVCSQNSYVKYFGYNKNTVQGVYKSKYTLANWITLIENELNHSRPVQYVGNDSINNAGHTWVCDGYDSTNNFHMNWGWGGADNGYFSPSALNVSGYDFDWWDEAVIGIEPAPVSAYFSGTPTFGSSNLTVNFSDSSISNAPITAYKWLFPGGNPATSNIAKPTVVYNTPGTYDVTEIVTDANGTDTVVRKAYISVAASSSLALQDFQSSTFPPKGWVINNPCGYSYTWILNTNVGGYGNSTQCMWFNNTQVVADFYTIYTGLWVNPPGKPAIDVIGQRQQIYSPEYDFFSVPKPQIYFDVAYAPYNTTFSDTLNIYYSTDFGKTFHQIYSKGGMTLCTTGNTVKTGADTNSKGIFVPASNNWRTDTISIPAIAGFPNVMFSFENRSGNGAALYIDNIHIPGIPNAVQDMASDSPSVKVYPNPSGGKFTIELSGGNSQWSVEVYNVLGEKVYVSACFGSAQQPSLNNLSSNSIDLSSHSKGVYLYRVLSKNGSVIGTGKLIID